MEELFRQTVAVTSALRERDENTYGHCSRTRELCLEMGRALRLSSADLDILRLAAELHDVGKIGIPDRVLFKPGRLDEEDRKVMNTHPRRGYDILVSIPDRGIGAVATIVLHHHEAVDGSGYPQGLSGEAIPLLARIVCIVDSYDAMATVRPYHVPRSHAQIMRMLDDAQGRKYDPYVLGHFSKVIESSQYRATA